MTYNKFPTSMIYTSDTGATLSNHYNYMETVLYVHFHIFVE